ncbi:hypothetical protein M011DRAFT_518103 [Sporormia fimetaria CBS 119925]|uniref:Plus3 domain-containing protein n=1 Tax=Sporormia fimetaria CBS 119925 TaxID=1340428 RepID=A0A6A6VG66_9PLEO|nr:hypothetical protein M011DRAFT_518103 [Sporormia fimetaria CBS 119925]
MATLEDELFAMVADDDGEVEEGEASSAPPSPNSLGSDAMEESDSEADNDDNFDPSKDDELNPYPLEGKYKDAADKAYVLGLSLLEREALLGERIEEQNKLRFQAELKQRVQQSTHGAGDRKRKATSSEPDDSQRRSIRQKVKPAANNKLEQYKRNRAEQHQQRQRNDDRRNGRRRSSSVRSLSDVDADGESEVEYTDYPETARRDNPAELKHLDYVRLSRGFFSEHCFTPGLDDACIGAYVRMAAGQDSQKRIIYKMAQIKGFETGKPYVMEGRHGKKFGTNIYIVAHYGHAKKNIQMVQCSNDHFKESEFDSYRRSLEDANMRFPTESTLRKKFDDINRLVHHTWTDAEISEAMKKKREFDDILHPKSEDQRPKIATQTQLVNQRIAENNRKFQRNEAERIRQVQAEARKRAHKERMAELRRAQKEEEERRKAEAEKAEVEAQKSAAAADDDLFGDDGADGELPKTEAAPKAEKKEKPMGLPTFRKPKLEEDIYASMDVADIEI